ncbi:MAG: TetM/TetW/TetO/TetS family tetracycline resistance ribosomal protection protein [Clostridia bacterium]|nr:TetM/TetW/TetO/TetS family tetracycline resistance ribosomal protection protein [Clostridia bacterium]
MRKRRRDAVENERKKAAVGILAHVDAGKTTLSEALLFCAGALRKIGRVDRGDAFLDNNEIERERGITVFSKQAMLSFPEADITLIDTPGHVDFSGEAERTLAVLDYAVLVVSGSEGVQSHTKTIWNLLRHHGVPTFIFVNKMDISFYETAAVMRSLRNALDGACVDFSDTSSPDFGEEVASLDENILDSFLESGEVKTEDLQNAILGRRIIPCFFGSALKNEGVEEFAAGLCKYIKSKKYPDTFGARVYKITRDAKNARLTHLKITGGTLASKMMIGDEKTDQIRFYSGEKFITAEKATAGDVCTVTGLNSTYAGQGLGFEMEGERPQIEPILSYSVKILDGTAPAIVYDRLKLLSEEDPLLAVSWDERAQESGVRVMGEIQLQVLRRTVRDRFGTEIDFGAGRIVYKETIRGSVEGVGHFEPLRHYAEVHLLLEEGEEGSGLVFDTLCSDKILTQNFQRLVLTHLAEKTHRGVLTGAPITDMKITLISGKAHLKHTEGGDFRQATYRAVRQGLMKAESVLLEPYYDFEISVPAEAVGRLMNDINRMGGDFEIKDAGESETTLAGSAAVSELREYPKELTAYTKGEGRIFLTLSGYRPAARQDEIVAASGYDPESDLRNSPDSVFCSGGAGFNVKWDQVEEYMHLEGYDDNEPEPAESADALPATRRRRGVSYADALALDRELVSIFEKTYGPIRRKKVSDGPTRRDYDEKKTTKKPKKETAVLPEFVLVDGYNIIFAWEDLKKIAQDNLNLARKLLTDILCNYQGYRGCGLILVFDAYKVAGGRGSVEKEGGISVVYTKEAETADAYIERVTYEIGKKYRVRVATSDNLEQIIVLGHGAERVSARAFYDEVRKVAAEIFDEVERLNRSGTV